MKCDVVIDWDFKKRAFYIHNKVCNPLNKKNIRSPCPWHVHEGFWKSSFQWVFFGQNAAIWVDGFPYGREIFSESCNMFEIVFLDDGGLKVIIEKG